MCIITEKLKERFCKDLNLPIKIFKEPYFEERLNLYDNLYHCKEKYSAFVELVNKCGGEQQYFEMYNKVKDDAIKYLNENPYMQHFSKEEDFTKFQIQNIGFPKHDIYHKENDGKHFVSFDMKKGNFTALHHYDKRIISDCENYEEFLGLFTKETHLIYSKYIRQVIFGNLNPKRQVAYEQFLMDKVLTEVLLHFSKEQIVYFSTDEIVVQIPETNLDDTKQLVDTIVQKYCEQNINIRGDIFVLHKIDGLDGYIKEYLYSDKDIDIKNVNHLMMPFVLRGLFEMPVTDNDLVFMYDGMLVKMVEVPKVDVHFNLNRKE